MDAKEENRISVEGRVSETGFFVSLQLQTFGEDVCNRLDSEKRGEGEAGKRIRTR